MKRVPLLLAAALASLSVITHERSASASNMWILNYSPGHTVLYRPRLLVVYWGFGPNPEPRKAWIQNTLISLSGSKFLNPLTQYYEIDPVTYAQHNIEQFLDLLVTWDDDDPSNPLPATLTGPILVAESDRARAQFPWLADDTMVAIATPTTWPGQSSTPDQVYGCGSHGPRPGTSPASKPLIFWPARHGCNSPGLCCGGASDKVATTQPVGHELIESLTDPFWNGWRDWALDDVGENADQCKWDVYGTVQLELLPRTNPIGSTVQLERHWSNAANGGAGACVMTRTTRDDTFAVQNGQLLWRWGNGGTTDGGVYFSNWGNFGSSLGDPSAASWGWNRLDIFARAANGEIHHAYTDSGWNPPTWHSYGYPAGTVTGDPAAMSWRPHQIEVFVFAQSGYTPKLYRRDWDDGADTGWVNVSTLPVAASSAPTVIGGAYDDPAGAGKRIDLFYVGTDSNLWHGWTMNNFADGWFWDNYGTASGKHLVGRPSVASMQRNHFDVYVRNAEGSLSHRWWFGTYTGWDDVPAPSGQTLTGSPAAVGLGDGRILVQCPTIGGGVWRNLYDSYWRGWQAPVQTGVTTNGITASTF